MKSKTTSSDAAKERWKFLAQALRKKNKNNVTSSEYSVRNFSGYDLYSVKPIEVENSSEKWCSYKLNYGQTDDTEILVRLVGEQFTAEELRGFNNTGNVCIWPSEEVLSYYCYKHKQLFENKHIIELGCGMSALAGLQVAATLKTKEIVLSDGNEKGIDNLNIMLKSNHDTLVSKNVNSVLLKWDEGIYKNDCLAHLHGQFDVIISADCLFFVNFHKALVTTIQFLLAPGGHCIFFAPQRSNTLNLFVEAAGQIFDVEVEENYDTHIWGRYQYHMQNNKHFDKNLHYPILVKLSGKK
ncbi:calmodulin-lysine N-methyltransferase-like [Clytia hemisphaerica]|uniref:Calmodulin-lysine N-methyltransferase n=1 Tax=Clytia hemisphaerica TaxID=252671 RepID=A0A7M5UXE3_9CNID